MDDIWDELGRELQDKMRIVQKDFQATVKSEFDRGTGKLGRSFQPKINKVADEITSISWQMPRYGWILHHGISRGEQAQGSIRSFTYQKGLRSSGFVNTVMDVHYKEIADHVSDKIAYHVADIMRY